MGDKSEDERQPLLNQENTVYNGEVTGKKIYRLHIWMIHCFENFHTFFLSAFKF